MKRGSRMTPEQRKRISDGKRGKPNGRLGAKHTAETRAKMSKIVSERTPRGDKHYAWKGGTKYKKQGDRSTPEYRKWRLAVFTRDCFTCQICTVYLGGGNLEAHHLKSYADYPELRYDVDNGITLCHYHHQYEVHDTTWLKPPK
jgi:Pyruvate/2-oxoacid:ferredoxin oxidoreductase delta subunit